MAVLKSCSFQFGVVKSGTYLLSGDFGEVVGVPRVAFVTKSNKAYAITCANITSTWCNTCHHGTI